VVINTCFLQYSQFLFFLFQGRHIIVDFLLMFLFIYFKLLFDWIMDNEKYMFSIVFLICY